MKRIVLLCIGMMSLTNNATSISDVVKEHKSIPYSCAIAAIGFAGLAYYFHQNPIVIIDHYKTKKYFGSDEKPTSNNCKDSVYCYGSKNNAHLLENIDTNYEYTYCRSINHSTTTTHSRSKSRNICIIGSLGFAGLSILTYLNNK